MRIYSCPKSLATINLNLLPTLHVLLEERSVGAAAARMGVSQSAMSHSLAKLRTLVGDKLLVAAGGGMVATPRGEQLAVELPPLMAALQAMLAEAQPFDPRSARRRFRIATYDYFEFTTLPDILGYLRSHAPGIGLDVERLDGRSIRRLVAGELDFVMAGQSSSMPSTLRQRTLYRDPFAVIVRKDNPLLPGRLTLKRYTELEHVLISVAGRASGVVDDALAKLKQRRHVALRLPHFSSAALAVMHSDMICTVASTVAQRAKELYGLRVLTPPLALPRTAVVAWWPQQHQQDPGSIWLRDVLFSGSALSSNIRKLMREGK